ncbi:MAG TPA: hypothetical protein P5181_12705, partial [Dermatophilaceae bacterium]|nr:hypothetical protein [Dermatophilaceae bacterium]
VAVEIRRDTFIRLEIWGEFDIQTAAEQAADRHGTSLPARANPNDGICRFRVRLRIAEDRGSWDVVGEFRAVEGDLDGLVQGRSADGTNTGLNLLGGAAVLGPLASAVAELSPAAGTLVELGAMAVGAAGLLKVRALTLRGGELVVSQGVLGADGSTSTATSGTQVSVMLDVEVSFTFDITIIRVHPDHPISTRYKAIGLRSAWGTRTSGASVEYLPVPVFDPSKGYSLDIEPGALSAIEPLDRLLRILGVRVSRDNPTYLEVEVGMGVALGPVTIDTIRVRVRLDAAEIPQLTKLGATLDIPATVHGSGWVKFTETGFEGAIDVTLTAINLRAAAQFAIAEINGVVGVLIGAEVELPVPIVLGGSGLGIFGFMGGVAINFARKEPVTAEVPALEWLKGQMTPPRTGVMDPQGWGHAPDRYSIAAGLLLGTVEGGYVLHLKGVLMIELPGPRILLMMKADVIKAMPSLGSQQQATFLAVLDLDFGRGSFSIGIVADYQIQSILRIHVPVRAFFTTSDPDAWLVELGSYDHRVSVNVLDVIDGSGYLMIHGDGLTIPGLPAVPSGLAIATGFHIQAVLMGSKAVGLYLEVAAGFDAIVGFDPFFVAGKIYARGELRLFVISLSAYAELEVAVGRRVQNGVETDDPYIHGKACGKVDLFFFSIEGCVELTIGAPPNPDPKPRPLVASVKLVSRTPALVEGSGTDRAIESTLGEAREKPSDPLVVVPIDSVPVVMFDAAPEATGLSVLGAAPFGTSGVAGPGAWTRIGERWWAYQVTAVELVGAITSGSTPSSWWNRSAPPATEPPALALLNWLPTPYSVAIPYGETLTEEVRRRWGNACRESARPAEQLWTFDQAPLGPSAPGWRLRGIPWPDAPGTVRSSPASSVLEVTEPWRCGDRVVDGLLGIDPATVLGDHVVCPRFDPSAGQAPLKVWQPLDPHGPTAASGDQPGGFAQATERMGGSLADYGALRQQASQPARAGACDGKVLRSPTGDTGQVPDWLPDEDAKTVKMGWDAMKFDPDQLADAVRLRPDGGLSGLTLLLLVPREVPSGSLVVSTRDADDTELDRIPVTSAHHVSASNPIPARWLDAAGPWGSIVERCGREASQIVWHGERGYDFALVTLDKLDEQVDSIVIGHVPQQKPYAAGPFYLVAAAGVTWLERRRAAYDSTTVVQDRQALSTALATDGSSVALLTPGTTYTVRVTWSYDSDAGPDQPTRTPVYANPTTQTFEFATDDTSHAPADLAPWVLTSAPGMDDTGAFCKEPLRLILSTQAITKLYAGYGRHLEVTVRASSGKHPEPPGGGAAGAAYRIEDSMFTAAKGFKVMTPWEQAVRELGPDIPCVSMSETIPHPMITLAYDLDPLTDYLVDVWSVPNAAGGERRRVHRVGFTTSRFDSVAHLASWLAPAAVEHRLVRTSAPITGLPDRPTGRQVDDAVQAAGLPVPQTPDVPRVQVWWSADAVPQPVAVVLEGSEQLFRQRRVPTVATVPPDAVDPTHVWWTARPGDWLTVRQAPSLAGDPPAATVTRIIRCPGDTRVICLLAPGARGRSLALELVHHGDPVAGVADQTARAMSVAFVRAPWEVED